MNTYDLTERIMASETTKDGEAILIEALEQFANSSKMIVDNFERPNLLQKKGQK
jgi:hypothetical protein